MFSISFAVADYPDREPLPVEIHQAFFDVVPLNKCPMAKAESEEICSGREKGENDYDWLRRVEKAATASAREKFEEAHGSEECPDTNGECLKCRGGGEMKEGTCELFPKNQTKPSEIPYSRSTTHDSESDEVCSQVTFGCTYRCVAN